MRLRVRSRSDEMDSFHLNYKLKVEGSLPRGWPLTNKACELKARRIEECRMIFSRN